MSPLDGLILSPDIGNRLMKMLRDYESTKTRGSVYNPGSLDSGVLIRPVRVTVKCSAGTSTLATSDGRGTLKQIGPTGTIADHAAKSDDVVIWNAYPAEVPVGGLIFCYSYGGRWFHLTYSCP